MSLFIFASCNFHDEYFEYSSIRISGWSKDSLYVFRVPINDTTSTYNIYVNVRNRGEYPYQNLWLFMRTISPDTIKIKDSIECFLADQRGKWLGSGMGSIMEMPILYKQNIKYHKKGVYQYQIGHGMRDSLLTGINDIGLRIEKTN
jgi:gliding motility-associated lipoprotein GldH